MLHLSAKASLYEACVCLKTQDTHYVAVTEQDAGTNILSVLSDIGILQYLVSTFKESRPLFEQTATDLGIGTYGDIATVTLETPLVEVLGLLIARGLPAIPVVDPATGQVRDIYFRRYIMWLARSSSVSTALGIPVGQVLKDAHDRGLAGHALHTCKVDTTLRSLFELFAVSKVNMLVCVDDEGLVKGVVTLRDLLSYCVVD